MRRLPRASSPLLRAAWLLPLLLLSACFDPGCLRSACRTPSTWIAFNPVNNDELLLEWCFPDAPCTLAIRDLKTGQARLLPNIPTGYGGAASFSPDGQQIVFGRSIEDGGRQLAIINVDGSGFRLLTTGPYTNASPRFSADGTWLVFARAYWERVPPEKRPGLDWDVYEMSMANTSIRRRTRNGFLSINNLFYLNAQGDLLASPFPPHAGIDGEPREAHPSVPGVRDYPPGMRPASFLGWKSYLEKHHDNHVHLIDRQGIHPEPYIVQGDNTPTAVVSADLSTIVYKSVAQDDPAPDKGHDLFLWDGERGRRITAFRASLGGYAVSGNGRRIAVLVDKERDRNYSLWVLNADGTDARVVPEAGKPDNFDEWVRVDPRFAKR